MAAVSQPTFSNAFSWMKIFSNFKINSLKFAPKGPINNIPGDQATSHYLLDHRRIYTSLGLNELTKWRSFGSQHFRTHFIELNLFSILVSLILFLKCQLWSYIYIRMEVKVRRTFCCLMSVITSSNLTQSSAVMTDENIFWMILRCKWDGFWVKLDTLGLIYVINVWPPEGDWNETNKFLFIACRVSKVWISVIGVNVIIPGTFHLYSNMNMLIAWTTMFWQ